MQAVLRGKEAARPPSQFLAAPAACSKVVRVGAGVPLVQEVAAA